MPQYDYRPYVGLPWVPPLGCFELVRRVYRELYDIALDNAPQSNARAVYAAVQQRIAQHWLPIAECDAREGDVILLRTDPYHVGLVISAPDMLHCIQGETSRVESWRGAQWGARVMGFYRHA